MDRSPIRILILSLVNGVLGWILFSALFILIHPDASFAQTVADPQSMIIGVAAFAGSLVGFWRKSKK